jgi:hypothetical protein
LVGIWQVVKVTEEGAAWFVTLPTGDAKGSENLKAAQALVDAAVADSTSEDKRTALPAFPAPDKPRKQVKLGNAEGFRRVLTHSLGVSAGLQ